MLYLTIYRRKIKKKCEIPFLVYIIFTFLRKVCILKKYILFSVRNTFSLIYLLMKKIQNMEYLFQMKPKIQYKYNSNKNQF